MANSAQAKKRARQAAVQRLHNMAQRSAYRTAVKKVRKAIEAGDKAAAQAALNENMAVIDSLAEGGLLVYETFAVGHEVLGKPSNPAFLLREGELLEWCRDLRVVAFEDGLLTDPPRRVQRIVARRGSVVSTPLESWVVSL